MSVEVAQVELPHAGGVVVALDDRRADGAHESDAGGRLGAVADDVPHAEDLLDAFGLEPLEHRFQCGEVRVDVAEDAVSGAAHQPR